MVSFFARHTQAQQRAASWLLVVLLPLLTAWLGLQAGLRHPQADALAILLGVLALWATQLLTPGVIALLNVLLLVLLDVMPVNEVVASLSSDGVLILFSLLVLSAAWISSGLGRRSTLLLLSALPDRPFWRMQGIMLSGAIHATWLPSPSARLHLLRNTLAPLPARDGHAWFALWAGASLSASWALAGKPGNVMAFGLFDSQTRLAFGWVQWPIAASASIALLWLAHTLASHLYLPTSSTSAWRPMLREQLAIQGPMQRREWGMLTIMVLLLLGILTAPIHKIPLAWLLLLLVALAQISVAPRLGLLWQRLDGSVLWMVATVITWGPTLHAIGLDALLIRHAEPGISMLKHQLPTFMALWALCVLMVRLLLPQRVAETVLLLCILPLAEAAGISQWVLAFVVLLLSDAEIFACRSRAWRLWQRWLARSAPSVSSSQFGPWRYPLTMLAARLGAVSLSLPLWSALDIL